MKFSIAILAFLSTAVLAGPARGPRDIDTFEPLPGVIRSLPIDHPAVIKRELGMMAIRSGKSYPF